ncbi:hypothetical protein ACGTNG_00985 [Halomonas sp. 1390]|uniref:hypothetical protein n=1 Tax=Halomonas sp. B23F22_3 TaxID=3459516 RepID=UPI00373EAE7D
MAISFNQNFYLNQKLEQLQEAGETGFETVADVLVAIQAAGLTAEAHFAQYGAAEGLSPSAEFDTNAYLSAKLADLQANGETQFETTADVLEAFQAAGLSPLEHFNQYGEAEGLEATPVAASELTEALETYKTALDEKEAFLEEGEFADDAAVRQELTDAKAAVTGDTQNVISAKILDAQEAKADAEAAIAEVDGLKAVVDAYLASETNLENATKAADDAAAELAGQETTFEALGKANNTLTVTDAVGPTPGPAAAGTIELDLQGDATASSNFVIYNKADVNSDWVLDETKLEEAQTFAANNGVEGLDALIADLQASLAADEAEVTAQAARNDALTELLEAEDAADSSVDNSSVTVDANTNVDGTNAPLTNALQDAEDTIEGLQQDLETRAELDADVVAAEADVAEMEALNQAITDAKATLEDSEEDGGFDVTLTEFSSGTATAENDLFVFSTDADGSSVAQFGAAGEDKIYVGDSFTRVDLESDAVFTDEQGDVSTMEVFFQQNGSDVVMTFEDKAFAGSGSSATEDLTEVTLTGVNVEDLSLENGYITVA